MFKIFFLGIFLALISLFPPSVFARDPYPRGSRSTFIEAPWCAADANPQTMLKADGKRSGCISFSCFFPNEPNEHKYKFINDVNIDTLQKATDYCNQTYGGNTGWNVQKIVLPPFIKTNIPGKADYDTSGYNLPFGPFFGVNSDAPGWDWVTTMAYGSDGHVNSSHCTNGSCADSCIFLPGGPESSWVKILRNTGDECVAPPYWYSTSGDSRAVSWWNWWKGQLDPWSLQESKINVATIFLGMDGEGRPYKSAWGWGNMAPGEYTNPNTNFYGGYVQAVFRAVKDRFPNRGYRAHFATGLYNALSVYRKYEMGLHWESLGSDESQAYYYRPYNPYGWHQIFTNNYYLTNSLGFGTDSARPYYQSILSALSKHTDGITQMNDARWGTPYQDNTGEFIKFIGRYIGKDINNTPGVWDALRETIHKKEDRADKSFSGKYGDYDFFLYRPEELDQSHTTPVKASELPLGTSHQLYTWNLPQGAWGGDLYVGRKNATGSRYLAFDIDDGWRYTGINLGSGISVDVRIVFLDTGTGTFYLQYKNIDNQWVNRPIDKTGTNLWKEAIINVSDANFNNNASEGLGNAIDYPTDFRIDSGITPVTVHLVEMIGNGTVTEANRQKAQVKCELVRDQNANALDGIYSIKVSTPQNPDQFYVRGKLHDQNHQPLTNQRLMFTYNTEWNYAKTIPTVNGISHYLLDTTNNLNRSGFVGAGGSDGSSPSWYTAQVYFPGNRQYQPSRNDCLFMVTNSIGPNDPNNTRMKITINDNNPSAPIITRQIIKGYPGNETIIDTRQLTIGKGDGYYADDQNAQTVQIDWTGAQQASSNNITFNFPETPPFTPPVSLKTGWNRITLPHPAYSLTSLNLPNFCKRLTQKPGVIRFSSIVNFGLGFNLQETSKYNIFCSQNTMW